MQLLVSMSPIGPIHYTQDRINNYSHKTPFLSPTCKSKKKLDPNGYILTLHHNNLNLKNNNNFKNP